MNSVWVLVMIFSIAPDGHVSSATSIAAVEDAYETEAKCMEAKIKKAKEFKGSTIGGVRGLACIKTIPLIQTRKKAE